MEYVWEIVLTVLCLMGLGLLVWCLLGRLVCPVPGQEVLAVLEGQGTEGDWSSSVRALDVAAEPGPAALPGGHRGPGSGPGRAGRWPSGCALRWPVVVLWTARRICLAA